MPSICILNLNKKPKKQELPSEVMEYSSFQLASAFYYSKKTHFSSSIPSNSYLENFAEMIQSSAQEDIYLLLKKYISNLYQENEVKSSGFYHKGETYYSRISYRGYFCKQYCLTVVHLPRISVSRI